MILAAGRGERMRPLTDRIPKPLLCVAGRPLIAHLIERLVREGIGDLIINLAYKGEHIEEALGDGRAFGARIRYSREPPGALDTGGGILNALPLLGRDPFLVVNGDIWIDYPCSRLPREPVGLTHLVLVPNPAHNATGDFGLVQRDATAARVSNHEGERLTFSGLGVYRPALFSGHELGGKGGGFPLGPLLRRAADSDQVTGERYMGQWRDIGTPDRLRELSDTLAHDYVAYSRARRALPRTFSTG